MNCEKIQEKLLDAPEAPEVVSHLESCETCRRFAEFHQLILTTDEERRSPPAIIEEELAKLVDQRFAARRRARLVIRRRWISAAAIFLLAAVISLGVFVRHQPSVWADGTLENALADIEQSTFLLSNPPFELTNSSQPVEELGNPFSEELIFPGWELAPMTIDPQT